jgi:sulfoxide reductase heme-binding subunit YedZ
MWPWCDESGRLSPLKLAVFVALFVPAARVGWRFETHALGADPMNAVIHEIGNWTIKLIFLAFAITPARRILAWPGILSVRRMVGVGAFAYAALHLVLYITDQKFNLAKVASEIVLRYYLTIGFTALLILAALAATSTDGMARRLGARRWRRLHQVGYVAALLAVIHFFMQTKADVDEPWVMAGLYAWLMLYRALGWWRGSDRKVSLGLIALLAPLAAVLAALGEAIYFRIKVGVDPLMVLETNFSTIAGVRPAVVVLAICLALSVAGALRALASRRARTPQPVRG